LNDGPGPLARPAVVASSPTRHFRQVFSATTGDHSRATRSHPNNPVRRHILAATLRAVRKREPAPHKLLAVCKPGPHRPAVPRKRVEVPALRTHQRVPPNQRPVLRSRTPESYKPGPMRWPLKVPKRLLRERELYSSLAAVVVLVLYGCRARHIQRRLSKLVRDVRCDLG
jgi:hypothetical protein